MKNLLLGAILALIMASCNGGANVVMNFKDANDMELAYYATSVTDNDNVLSDTIKGKDGKYEFNLDTVMRKVYIVPILKANASGTMPAFDMGGMVQFLYIPGANIKISGTLKDYKITGAKFYDDLTEIENKLRPLSQQMDSLGMEYQRQKMAGASDEDMSGLRAEGEKINAAMMKEQYDFIKANPSSLAAAFLFVQIPPNMMSDDMINVLTGEAKDGAFATVVEQYKASYEREKSRDAMKQNIAEGKPAPDFTLNKIDGTPFTLSSLKGKYVVLDFWGTWCGWCMKGMPEMKTAYDKYKSKIEFVGINQGDNLDKWKKSVAELKLPWINVKNEDGKGDVTLTYAISGFPTKIIIDPQGVILKIVEGESPEFYEALAKIAK